MPEEELGEDPKQLEAQVRAAVKARQDLERQLADPAALRSATARAYRDRDAVTNPRLEEARAKIADDRDAFDKEWQHIDTVTRNIGRLAEVLDAAPQPIQQHRDAIAAKTPAVHHARAQIAETLTTAGLAGIIPDPAVGADD
jgi:hypothetical protein